MDRLTLPGFTGKEVLYWTKREYKSYKLNHDSNVVIPSARRGALGYQCAGGACVCSGVDDCVNMIFYECGGEIICSKHNNCICSQGPGPV